MNTAWMLYWFTRLDAISGLLAAIMVIGVVAGPIFAMFYFINVDLNGKDSYGAQVTGRVFPKLLITAAIATVLLVLVPTQKDVAIIAGGQLAVNVANTPEAKELGSKVLEVINQQLDSQIKKAGK